MESSTAIELYLHDTNTRFQVACSGYIDMFCKKQDIEFDGWVNNEIGELAGFGGQYFFQLSDIIIDLNKRCPKRFIIQWSEDSTDFSLKGGVGYINYASYIKGIRHEDLTKGR